MQVPPTPTPIENDEADDTLPTDHVRNSPNLNRTFTVRRKAVKRTFPWDLAAGEIQLALPRPQDEDEGIRETKRPRLEEPFFASTDESTTEHTSHATVVALPPHDTATAAPPAESDPVMDMSPNARATGAFRRWTPEEDAKLISAVTKTRKKKFGQELSDCQDRLGCSYRAGSWANEYSVPQQMAGSLRHRPDDGTCWQMDSKRRHEVEECGRRARWQELEGNCCSCTWSNAKTVSQ
jgi:hypothetical protein